MEFVLYYIAGIIQDFLLTLNWRFVAKDKPVPATVFSILTTMVSMLVLYNIITQLDETRSLIGIIIYATGVGTGTYLGMKFKLDKLKKQ